MSRSMLTVLVVVGLGACARGAVAPGTAVPAAAGEFPAALSITEADLQRDLFALAGDEMRGREAGTIDELRASGWLAERAREAGLEPAGEDGTYFQWFDLRRTRQSATSRLSLGDRPLVMWRDVAVLGLSESDIDGPVLWLGDGSAIDTAGLDVSGRIVAILLEGDDAPPLDDALAARRWIGSAPQRLARPLLGRGAAAVIVVADRSADALFELGASNAMRGRYAIEDGSTPAQRPAQQPVLLARSAWARPLAAPGARFRARLTLDEFVYPSVNVVARVAGADPDLRGQYVLFSAHQDHDGVRASIAGDSIWNGADDNVTVAAAVLAIGRAFARRPGRRSALFVWHGAEEKGLFGSRLHAARPMVPRDSIVAVLNADMIGRNHPDTAALLGSIPPHRNSTDLVTMALEANERLTRFVIDSSWDRPEHREGWYFRSDHLPYARENVPALFFTSLLHADYHTPRDGPERIDVAKLTRITRWMYGTGWLAANSAQRPKLDAGFRLER